jgi:hypothetical protein
MGYNSVHAYSFLVQLVAFYSASTGHVRSVFSQFQYIWVLIDSTVYRLVSLVNSGLGAQELTVSQPHMKPPQQPT